MLPTLHLPLDFEKRASVRLLGRKLGSARDSRAGFGDSPKRIFSPADPHEYAVVAALRVWLDWASSAVEWRPFRRAQNDKERIEWTKEDLTFIIEGAAGWHDNDGAFMQAAVEAGFIVIEERAILTSDLGPLTSSPAPSALGLTLDGFWPLNEHLSPDYKSIQQRGGEARAARRLFSEVDVLAEQRREIFEKQGALPFGTEKLSPEEQTLCFAIFIRLYRACNLPVPSAADFTEAAMSEVRAIARLYTPEQISKVESWLIENRDNPVVVKIPARIISDYALVAAKAGVL